MKAKLLDSGLYELTEIVTMYDTSGSSFPVIESLGAYDENMIIQQRAELVNQISILDTQLAAISAAKGESNE